MDLSGRSSGFGLGLELLLGTVIAYVCYLEIILFHWLGNLEIQDTVRVAPQRQCRHLLNRNTTRRLVNGAKRVQLPSIKSACRTLFHQTFKKIFCQVVKYQ
jgi:hypothetical protein